MTPRTAGNLARHELVGLDARVVDSPDPTQVGLEGTIVDETRGTLVLSMDAGESTVPKPGRTFAVGLDGETVEIDGEQIAHRPGERTKKVRTW